MDYREINCLAWFEKEAFDQMGKKADSLSSIFQYRLFVNLYEGGFEMSSRTHFKTSP